MELAERARGRGARRELGGEGRRRRRRPSRRSGSRRSRRATRKTPTLSPGCVTICLLLHGGDAGVRVEDDDAGVGAIGEAVERGDARVAGGRDQDQVVWLVARSDACACSSASEKNSGMHCSAMSLNASVGPCHSSSTWRRAPTRRTGATRRVGEVGAVGPRRDRAHARGVHVEAEGLVEPRRALVVGQPPPAAAGRRRRTWAAARARTGRRRGRCPPGWLR